MKKLLSFVLALAIIVCAVPLGTFTFTASAESEEYTEGYYTYTVSNGEVTITDVDTLISGDITIPSTLGEYPVTSIGESAFSQCSNLKSISIPNSVTTVGELAFRWCDNLQSITVSEDNECFSSVDGVLFNKNKTSILVYPSGKNDASYKIPDGVTNIAVLAFLECDLIKSIFIPDSVTNIGNRAFYGCTGLKSIIIPDSVTSIDTAAFFGCASLTSIRIPNGVTNISDFTFKNCTSLTSITIPISVVSICSGAFDNCSKLVDVYYAGSFDDRLKISIGSENSYLTETNWYYNLLYEFNETNLTASVIDCGPHATTVTIPDQITENDKTYTVISIDDNAFNDCDKLQSITVSDNNEHFSSIDGVLFNKDKTSILFYPKGKTVTSYTIPDGVISIGNCAFRDCDSLTGINISSNVTTIGDYAFGYCDNLASIYIPNSVTSIGGCAFYYCTSLESITIPDSVTSIGVGAFANCTNLKSITIPNSVTSIGDRAFYWCENLMNATIGNGVTSMGVGVFSRCISLESVIINDGATFIGETEFAECYALENITIPPSVTNIGNGAFQYCGFKIVYYRGSELDKEKISIDGGNDALNNATWYYDSCISAEKHDYADATCLAPMICKGCGEISGEALGHRFDNACDTTCNFCDYTRTTTHSYYAKIYMANDDNHWKQCAVCGNQKDVSNHVYENDCDTTCDVCDYERETTHNYKTKWDYNDTHHWHQCSVCSDKIDEAVHVFDDANDIECNICSATFEQPITLISISISKKPTKVEYLLDEELDLTGIKVELAYDDGSIEIITSGFTISGFDSSTVGNKIITVEYSGFSASFIVNVIKCVIDEDDPQIVIESKKVTKGNQFTVDVLIKNNPGFAYLEVTPVYSSELTLVSVKNGDLISDFTKGKQYVWVANEDISEDGTLLTMTFNVDETVAAGNYQIGFNIRTCANYDEEPVEIFVVNSDIEVIDFVYGDATGDGVIDGFDVIRLKKYLANFDYDTQTSTVEIFKGADANGDEVIDGFDVIRLKKYLANFDYETGESTIVLGPQ